MSVARLLFFEVMPIHMPNQHNATMFASRANVFKTAEPIVAAICGPAAIVLGETMTVAEPDAAPLVALVAEAVTLGELIIMLWVVYAV